MKSNQEYRYNYILLKTDLDLIEKAKDWSLCWKKGQTDINPEQEYI